MDFIEPALVIFLGYAIARLVDSGYSVVQSSLRTMREDRDDNV